MLLLLRPRRFSHALIWPHSLAPLVSPAPLLPSPWAFPPLGTHVGPLAPQEEDADSGRQETKAETEKEQEEAKREKAERTALLKQLRDFKVGERCRSRGGRCSDCVALPGPAIPPRAGLLREPGTWQV